jgi:DNA processing protein
MEQDYVRQAAIVMASLELLPAQPSDLTGILRDPDQFHALVDLNAQTYETELVGYLRENLDTARIEHWHKQLDRLIVNEVALPVLAADMPGMPGYPARLAKCWDAPPILFANNVIREDQASVAIIGSRAAKQDTLDATHALAADLAVGGVAIVSGLAMGVDAAAHEGALAVNGYTIAVLGTGITRVYPEQNTELAHRIRANGTLVSQFAPYAPRTRTSFLRRNHVIAGLSDISIVMTGQSRSGSRHEIEQAMGYGRTVLMWEPALAAEKWARQLANSGRAAFISDSHGVRAALDRVGP